jgi:hypothetical protein
MRRRSCSGSIPASRTTSCALASTTRLSRAQPRHPAIRPIVPTSRGKRTKRRPRRYGPGPASISAATSATAVAGRTTRFLTLTRRLTPRNRPRPSAASTAVFRPDTITCCRPGLCSELRRMSHSRSFSRRDWPRDWGHRKAPRSPTRSIMSQHCAAAWAMPSVIGSSTRPAGSPGRRRAWVKLPASSPTRTGFCARARAGRRAWARRWPLQRTGPRSWNISTTISARSTARFPPGQRTNRHSTCRCCGWGSTASSTGPMRALPEAGPAIHGCLPQATGMSTGSSPSSGRAMGLSIRPTSATTVSTAAASSRIRRARAPSSACARGQAPKSMSIPSSTRASV